MNERRYDLDWLRIFAFGVLILYHVGMFYSTWDWHVKSSRASDAIEPLMRLSNPWRLSLLFLISGVATRFLADKAASASAFARSRLRRLGPPLLLAIFVIVPPQSYYEVAEALRQVPAASQQPWLQGFYLKYVTASGHWCDADGCLLTPTYNHMWFVAYLVVYSLALTALLPLLKRRASPSAAWRLRFIEGPGLVIVPWVVMFALRALLAPVFGQTHMIWNDGYLHPLYFGIFLFGFAMAKEAAFFRRCMQLRWHALIAALICWAALEVNLRTGFLQPGRGLADPIRLLSVGVHEVQAWAAILTCVGFAHRHLRGQDNRARAVLTEAIFPFYLVHQTIIVVVAHHLDPLQLPLPVEASLLILVTVGGCWISYDLGRRVAWLRPWIGLGPARSADDLDGSFQRRLNATTDRA